MFNLRLAAVSTARAHDAHVTVRRPASAGPDGRGRSTECRAEWAYDGLYLDYIICHHDSGGSKRGGRTPDAGSTSRRASSQFVQGRGTPSTAVYCAAASLPSCFAAAAAAAAAALRSLFGHAGSQMVQQHEQRDHDGPAPVAVANRQPRYAACSVERNQGDEKRALLYELVRWAQSKIFENQCSHLSGAFMEPTTSRR